MDLFGDCSAVISNCERYRYRLDRRRNSLFSTAIIMVNPSTADADHDDSTIRKLLGFAERKGWGSIIVGNLFAYRATDVRKLATADDPIGPENDFYLRTIIGEADQVVVAWGPLTKQPKALRDRWRSITDIAEPLGKVLLSIGSPALDGHPKHPLMLAYSEPIVPWRHP